MRLCQAHVTSVQDFKWESVLTENLLQKTHSLRCQALVKMFTAVAADEEEAQLWEALAAARKLHDFHEVSKDMPTDYRVFGSLYRVLVLTKMPLADRSDKHAKLLVEALHDAQTSLKGDFAERMKTAIKPDDNDGKGYEHIEKFIAEVACSDATESSRKEALASCNFVFAEATRTASKHMFKVVVE